MAFPSPVIVNATVRQTATVIFLHGLGDTGHGWSYAFNTIKLPYIKYICPSARHMKVTLNGGFEMPAWFDIISLSVDNKSEDEENVKASAAYVSSLVKQEEEQGIPSNRIVVGGFSQGGALALYTALTTEKPFAGVLALSCYLPLHTSFPAAMKGNKDTPILQCHGTADPVVNHHFGKKTAEALQQLKCSKHQFKSYPGLAHSSCEEELKDVRDWLSQVLQPIE